MWFFMLFGSPLGFLSMMSELTPAPRRAAAAPTLPEGLNA